MSDCYHRSREYLEHRNRAILRGGWVLVIFSFFSNFHYLEQARNMPSVYQRQTFKVFKVFKMTRKNININHRAWDKLMVNIYHDHALQIF